MRASADVIEEQLSSVVAAFKDATNSNGYIDDDDARFVVVRARAAIERVAPPHSAYLDEAETVLNEAASIGWRAEHLCAIVDALRADYRAGALVEVQELVHADLFSDFIEMALELSEKGFVGPAAVVAGSVLEEHLRKLAGKHGVDLIEANGRAKSVEVLGVDLRKAQAITEVQRKSVTAWYAQRTEAAHGRADALTPSEVERMIDGVRDFVARHPA
ncbi:MAG TPA: hypothetical protein VF250_07505 [Conexibacter sp.]